MNPSSNESAGLNLPVPVPEQAPSATSVGAESSSAATPETAPIESMPTTKEANNAAAQAFSVPLPATQGAPVNDATSTTKSVVPTTTDKDLIDKSIVDKAKAIIEKTKDNPYQQSEEITVFKADHLYKSYNRKIKTK